jgi:tetratricopeptide (TPR) repeat protein
MHLQFKNQRPRAKEIFSDLARRGGDTYYRRALAEVATLHFIDGEYVSARDYYRRYVTQYPQSPFAWVAAFRAAESDYKLGNLETAVTAYLAATDARASDAFVTVLARTYAGRVLEDLARFDDALRQYRAAYERWDHDYGVEYELPLPRGVARPRGSTTNSGRQVTRAWLQQRIRELASSITSAGGASIEQARRLLETREYEKGIQVLRTFMQTHPASASIGEARALLNRARLERSLQLIDLANRSRNERESLAEFEALSKEPFDFSVFAVQVARSAAAFTGGQIDEAMTQMTAALGALKAYQQGVPRPPATALEDDVTAIGNEVFRPLGDGVFRNPHRWNAFEWPERLPPFLIVSRTVSVRLASNEVVEVARWSAFPKLDNVLLLDQTEVTLLTSVLESVGGTERREPTAIMETPNQPIGKAREVNRFWNRFFPTRPGHWQGWEFFSYPAMRQIEFLDEARTRAFVRVTVGYSGATVVVEKVNGAWTAKELIDFWAT